MAEDKQRAENPGFSRLLDLLNGSYLSKGVRSSVASKLELVQYINTCIAQMLIILICSLLQCLYTVYYGLRILYVYIVCLRSL